MEKSSYSFRFAICVVLGYGFEQKGCQCYHPKDIHLEFLDMTNFCTFFSILITCFFQFSLRIIICSNWLIFYFFPSNTSGSPATLDKQRNQLLMCSNLLTLFKSSDLGTDILVNILSVPINWVTLWFCFGNYPFPLKPGSFSIHSYSEPQSYKETFF